MTNKAYLVVFAAPNPEHMAELGRYQEASGPILQKHGAIFPPYKGEVTQVLVGDLAPKFMIRLEFPSKENIQAAFADPDYLAIKDDRDIGLSNLSIFIVEE